MRGKGRGEMRGEDCVARAEMQMELAHASMSISYSSLVHLIAIYKEIDFTCGTSLPEINGK